MKSIMMISAVCLSYAAAASVPVVSNVGTEQSANRRVTITYELSGENAIVTPDIRTNRGDGVYISIGEKWLKGFTGDVNRKVVNDGNTKTIRWNPTRFWPEGGTGLDVKAYVTAWAVKAPPDYMAIDLEQAGAIWYYTSEDALPEPIASDRWRTKFLLMRKIPAKGVIWSCGTDSHELNCSPQENRHYVTLTKDYYMGGLRGVSRAVPSNQRSETFGVFKCRLLGDSACRERRIYDVA